MSICCEHYLDLPISKHKFCSICGKELSKEDRNECTHIRTHKNGICQICGGSKSIHPPEDKEIEKLDWRWKGDSAVEIGIKVDELIDAINNLRKQ